MEPTQGEQLGVQPKETWVDFAFQKSPGRGAKRSKDKNRDGTRTWLSGPQVKGFHALQSHPGRGVRSGEEDWIKGVEVKTKTKIEVRLKDKKPQRRAPKEQE